MALYNVDWIARCTFSYHFGLFHNITISVILILTSLLGFGGAAVQLRHMWQFRNSVRRRLSANPKIIVWLAFSDLIACVGKEMIKGYLFLFKSFFRGIFSSIEFQLASI